MGDLCLFEDGSERGDALDSVIVAADTADEGRSEDGERAQPVSRSADTNTNTRGVAAHSRLEIIVSLRTAASAETPSTPIELALRLQARSGLGMVRERGVSTGKSEHYRVAAHSRVVICVSLMMAASMEAPSSPMPLRAMLQARGTGGNGETVGVSTGAHAKANSRGAGGSVLERGQRASPERHAKLSDALGGVGAGTAVKRTAAELVSGQTAKERRSVNGR